jgi:transcriptional regulator with XRE-family HTH domain
VKGRLNPVRASSPTLRKLFAIMAEAGVSQQALADRISSTQYGVWKWRAGQATPNIASVEAAADALGYRLELVRNDE